MGAYNQALQPLHSAAEAAYGITEVVLPSPSEHQYNYVLPMLAHLSRQCNDRWLTWIAPRGIHRKLLSDFGFALEKLRIIYTHNDHETLSVLRSALANGNSATVVVSYESLSAQDIGNLEEMARIGNTQGLLLRHRREQW